MQELFRANHHLMQVVQHNLHEGHSGQSLQASSRSLLKASMSKLSSTSSSLSSKHRTLLYGAFRAIKSAGVRRAAEARGNDDASVAMLGVLERAVSRPLPPPLAPDNWETGSTTCYLMEQLEAMAVAPVSAGWNWTDEGRNKWGWVAMEAKQAIRFKVRAWGGCCTDGIPGRSLHTHAVHNLGSDGTTAPAVQEVPLESCGKRTRSCAASLSRRQYRSRLGYNCCLTTETTVFNLMLALWPFPQVSTALAKAQSQEPIQLQVRQTRAAAWELGLGPIM